MRVHLHGDETVGKTAGQLLTIGDGKYLIDTSLDVVQLSENIVTFISSIDKLVSRVYLDLLSNLRSIAWLSELCISAPLNETTWAINTTLLTQLPSECVSALITRFCT